MEQEIYIFASQQKKIGLFCSVSIIVYYIGLCNDELWLQ